MNEALDDMLQRLTAAKATSDDHLEQVHYGLRRFLEVQTSRPDRFVMCVSPDADFMLKRRLEEITTCDGIPVDLHYSAIMRPSDGVFVMAERPEPVPLS